ncbi:DUF6626 family protein [Sphingomonas sp. IC-11]|uniref:DUF6626 family protein n=1 Tax=Sphingomonas sp. IC-11 TaxID=2898528 RepID=UPI003FA7BF8A
MILDEVYLFLKNVGHAPTHATFSTDYLGHSARYYDYLRCSGAAPSLRSLLKVAMCLHDLAQAVPCAAARKTAALLSHRVMTRALTRCR